MPQASVSMKLTRNQLSSSPLDKPGRADANKSNGAIVSKMEY
jgi:hypothetical protein